jgi:hypothetical protein
MTPQSGYRIQGRAAFLTAEYESFRYAMLFLPTYSTLAFTRKDRPVKGSHLAVRPVIFRKRADTDKLYDPLSVRDSTQPWLHRDLRPAISWSTYNLPLLPTIPHSPLHSQETSTSVIETQAHHVGPFWNL